MQKHLDIFALVSYCGLIYWLSDQSRLPNPIQFEDVDKVQHFAAYFVMGLFAWRALAHWALPRNMLLWLSCGFCSVYGVTDEWHQSFVIGRDASSLDWLADTTGGLIAGVSYYLYSRKIALSTNAQKSTTI